MYSSNASATGGNSPSAYDQSDTAPESHNLTVGQHVEGHIAFLKAELEITPAQESLWEVVSAAMREDVRDIQNAERMVSQQTHGRETAIQYLQNRVMFANLRAQGEARFLAALQPLYEGCSKSQKQIADDLLVSSGSDQ